MMEEEELQSKRKKMQEPERVMPTEAHDCDSLEGDDQRSGDERLRHDEEEEEEEDDDDDDDEADDSALQKAARAGIQLLEENAQLADEVRELQLQLAHGYDQTQEMSRMLDDKEVQVDQLTQHLRESIRENQRLLAELTQAKKETLSYTNLLAEQQQQLQESPRKRLVRVPSPKQRAQQTQQRMRSKSLLVSLEQASIFHTVSTSAMRSDPVAFGDQDNQNNLVVASAPVGLNSPRRRQAAAKLDEVEAKYEEEHRRNSVLKMELQSAQRKISELKPLHAQLHEAKEEIQVLQAQMDELEKKLALSWEESAEERELIQSLRTTIEIYQKLDEPNTSIKDGEKRSHYHGINAGDDVQVHKLARMRRRKSDGCIFPKTPPPNRWTSPAAEGSFQSRDDTTDVILETLDNLAEQLLQLKQPELVPSHIPKSPGRFISPNISTTDISMNVASVAIRPQPRFVEQQVAVLQDLLKRYRSQWHQSSEKRSAIEIENIRLLSRVEELTRLLQQQCDTCARANESMAKEEEAWQSAATSYKTLLQQISDEGKSKMEEDAEAEHACFSILRRLTDSWTADKSKRMHLHDWLTNAIRSTGIRRPLYLPDLTREVASGFEVLLIPILREKFGVQIHVEKRLRNVIVTDLRLQVTETDTEKAQACLQRIRRSLMWLVDVEATQLENKDWVDEVSRRKAARMCLKTNN